MQFPTPGYCRDSLSDLSAPCSLSLNGEWDCAQIPLNTTISILDQVDKARWSQITVPGNWYSEGYDVTGLLYKTEFKIGNYDSNHQYRLQFDAIDYFSDIWLNGVYFGKHEGYFQPFAFDVTNAISSGGYNTLVVKVEAPLETKDDWSLHKKYIKGVFGHHDTRPGGAWSERGQECSTGGVWGGVSLQISRNVLVDSLGISSRIEGSEGIVDVAAKVFYPGIGAVKYTFSIDIEKVGGGVVRSVNRIVTIHPGANHIVLNVSCPDAKLWWPYEMGEQSLYRAILNISKKGLLRATQEKIFAFRNVVCDSVNHQWFINGKRLFLRGTNYISSQWLAEMGSKNYSFDISLMQRAHINVIRVHAHLEAGKFYDLCDQAGMLIVQDFPLQWGYSDEPIFHQNAIRQSREMVSMLTNHPSVIQWVLHNEPPWDADWMKYRYPDYSPDQNKALDARLFETVTRIDPARPTSVCSHTKEHPWFGWYSGKMTDYNKPTHQATVSEFGAQALPDFSTLRTIFPDSLIWPTRDADWSTWQYHNFQPHETFDLAIIPKGNSIHELIGNTQNYQADLIQIAAESYRRQRYNPVTSVFQFMFAETWPSVNWGMLDYLRNPKPGYEALALAYQPVLPLAVFNYDSLHVRVSLIIVNDTQKSFRNMTLTCSIENDNQISEIEQQVASITSDTLIEISPIRFTSTSEQHGRLLLRLTDSEGNVLGINRYALDKR